MTWPPRTPESFETEEIRTRQKLYIAAYLEAGGVKRKACRMSGLSESTVYEWFREDPVFVQNVKEAEAEWYESLVAMGIQRAAKKSDTLLIFFLKARYPEIYDDNYRRVQWEKNAESELREKHPLPQILVNADPKPEQPK